MQPTRSVLLLGLCLLLLSLPGCGDDAGRRAAEKAERKAFVQLRKSGTAADYEAFLATWPDGRFAKRAQTKLEILRLEPLWRAAQRAGTQAAYAEFWDTLQRERAAGTSKAYASFESGCRAALRASVCAPFLAAKSKLSVDPTRAELEAYLAEFGPVLETYRAQSPVGGAYDAEHALDWAREMLVALEERDRALASDDFAALGTWHETYRWKAPSGWWPRVETRLRRHLRDLGGTYADGTQGAERLHLEEVLHRAVEATSSEEACRLYLRTLPEGRHAQEVRTLLGGLAGWRHAQATGTAAALAAFARRHEQEPLWVERASAAWRSLLCEEHGLRHDALVEPFGGTKNEHGHEVLDELPPLAAFARGPIGVVHHPKSRARGPHLPTASDALAALPGLRMTPRPLHARILLVRGEVHHGVALYRPVAKDGRSPIGGSPKGHAITVCWWVLDLHGGGLLGRLLVRTFPPERVTRSILDVGSRPVNESPYASEREAFAAIKGS